MACSEEEYDLNKRKRTVVRTAFTRTFNGLDKELKEQTIDLDAVESKFNSLEEKMQVLAELDEVIFNFILLQNDNQLLLFEEEIADEYRSKFVLAKVKVNKLLSKTLSEGASDNNSVRSCQTADTDGLKLPRIDFKKFNGDIGEWLPFWSQFQRVHNNLKLADSVKFYYLNQAMVPNSKAQRLIESYPMTDENYGKALQALKSRFGREDLLIEFYVRELLKLLINYVQKKVDLVSTYDNLEAKLRALESLGVTTDSSAAMLYPLVESCIPEDTLRAWHRSSKYETDSDTKSRLNNLTEFLKKEVENEEQISLAVNGLGFQATKKESSSSRDYKRKETLSEANSAPPPTASGLLAHRSSCAFCKMEHPTQECTKADKMQVSEKRELLGEKGCCFKCLGYSHIASKCRVSVKCDKCSRKHLTIMCPGKQPASTANNVSKNKEQTLSNTSCSEVYLQTLVVRLRGAKEKNVRAVFDSGSVRSYIKKSTALEMGYDSLRQETIVHGLFGGVQTESNLHECYRVRACKLDESYACNFEALDEPIVCSNIAHVRPGDWLKELKKLNIEISDTQEGPIELLIGADIASKLLTGKRHELSFGVVAFETLLGWTLMGKRKNLETETSAAMMVSSLLSTERCISDIWKLDSLGITDPGEKNKRQDIELEVKKHFLDTVSINKEGRYEVCMPWIEGHPPIASGLEVAKKRLNNLLVKLKKDGYYDEYQKVFDEWIEEGVIEEVPGNEFFDLGHYLPHRHVVKLSSATTKVPPVFDASAHEKGSPSVNQCLEKGINLIELVPASLLRFRQEKIGFVSDIRRAFLQISLCSNDRNYLKFLWKTKDGVLKVYRHTRVVFGITCSPFLLGAVIDHHLEKEIKRILNNNSPYLLEVITKLRKSYYMDNCVSSVRDETELKVFIVQSARVMMDGKFDLRGWEYSFQKEPDSSTESKVLGLLWNKEQDTIRISEECYLFRDIEKVTRRSILSAAHKHYDPIGFTAPVILYPKLLLQKTWSSYMRIKFNPPTAAWWGGWWERLIRTIKDLLRKSLHCSRLDGDELYTVLCEVESIMNNRPLTDTVETKEDLACLTPAMFLHGLRGTGAPDLDIVEGNISLTKRWKIKQQILNSLKKIFRQEYLGQLVQWKREGKRQVQVGDLVLLEKENTKRLSWPLARVLETIPGRDNQVRVVRLKTAAGEVLRPVQRIYPLELHQVPNLSGT